MSKMIGFLAALVLLAVSNRAQIPVEPVQRTRGGQCYQFVDASKFYNLQYSPGNYPRAGIAEEYGRRSELQRFLGNIMSPIATLKVVTPNAKASAPGVGVPQHRVNPPQRPELNFGRNYIPKAYAGAKYPPRHPYQEGVSPYQQYVSLYQPQRPPTQQHLVNIPGSFIGHQNPQRNLAGVHEAPASNYPKYLKAFPGATQNHANLKSQIDPLAQSKPQENPRLQSQASGTNIGDNKPLSANSGRLTFEQLRKLATPIKRQPQRFGGYNSYINRTPRYHYGNGHIIRKRSNRFTYQQLQDLVTPWRNAYPTYPGPQTHQQRGSYIPYRYVRHNGFHPYSNNFNPYAARRYTLIGARASVAGRRSPSPRYSYDIPHYRHKRSYRVEPHTMEIVKPISETCPSKKNQLHVFSAYSGNCFVIEPMKQMITYANCGHDDCQSCKASTFGGVSKCTENYSWVSMWAYCENLPENEKIREIELYLPQSCSCKTYQC